MKPQEFIEIVLKNGIKNVIEKAKEPYLAFSLISQGIEILGFIWCENINGFPLDYEKDKKKFSEMIFKQGLSFFPKHNGIQYKVTQMKDYLRNSMIHQLRPDENLIVSSDPISEEWHLKEIKEKQYILSLNPLFNDFCIACNELIKVLDLKYKNIENPKQFLNSTGFEIDGIFIGASGGPFPVSYVTVLDIGESNSEPFGN